MLFQRAVILGTCTLVTILYAMTVTIANVSLPQMQGALSVTQDQITLNDANQTLILDAGQFALVPASVEAPIVHGEGAQFLLTQAA